MYPKIYLAMDNCAFYKRWTRPSEWAEKMAELGIHYIEASADTELDPLYMGPEYLNDWVNWVKEAENTYGVKVCNLYSGHGTYTTLGLTHTDTRVRERMITKWFFPMLDVAAQLDCGMGFFAHAFNHDVLQNDDTYQEYVQILIDGLTRINRYAEEQGCGKLGVEQMYTPHQYPWRMNDTVHLLREVTRRSGRDFYFTEDVGHHHIKFQRPEIRSAENGLTKCWLGTDQAYEIARSSGRAACAEIEQSIRDNPNLFSEKEDGDCYRTLKTLGCYSPIVHLQQTSGTQSAHLPFPGDGIISGPKVLRALKESYEQPDSDGMPAKVDKIYLTLELFSGTTSIMQQEMDGYQASVNYWRQYIPNDGMLLDELVDRLENM